MRPLRAAPGAGPVVDLRAGLSGRPAGEGDAWERAVRYVRSAGQRADRPIVTLKAFGRCCGADQFQLDAVLVALDAGRPVAFYGWWPTAQAATTTEILGVDAMEVPPPDRKGRHLVDGHAVAIVGYGRHAAFPGGGYLIVRSGWGDAGWGEDGDGYMPFTYVRAYATELCTTAVSNGGRGEPSESSSERTFRQSPGGDGPPSADRPPAGSPRLPAILPRDAIDVEIDRRARCADPRASLTHLFFSEDALEVARARAICGACAVREPCLRRALERHEPCGVWGGELVIDGAVVAEKRRRGRPPKAPRPRLVVDEITGAPLVPIAV